MATCIWNGKILSAHSKKADAPRSAHVCSTPCTECCARACARGQKNITRTHIQRERAARGAGAAVSVSAGPGEEPVGRSARNARSRAATAYKTPLANLIWPHRGVASTPHLSFAAVWRASILYSTYILYRSTHAVRVPSSRRVLSSLPGPRPFSSPFISSETDTSCRYVLILTGMAG